MFATVLFALMAVVQTDQTVPVQKGTRLDISNFAGDVSIKVWDKDAVRVQVSHSDRETIDIKPLEQTLQIRSHNKMGPPRSLDYEITIPIWMPITVTGTYADVTMDGVGSDVSVETTRGDVKVRGGSGLITLKSISGDVTLEKAKGKIEVHALNEGIHLADISGDVSAETTNGDIVLDRLDSGNVDLYTVNGNISYDGPIKDKGVYRLTTHNGLIGMAVPEKANATLMVRTYTGGFKSSFPLKLDDQNPKKRFTVTYGNGSAHVELESFGGTIALRRPGEPRPETERKRRIDRHVDRDRLDEDAMDATIDAAVDGMVEPVIDSIVDATIDVAVRRAMSHISILMPVIRTGPMPFSMPMPMPAPIPKDWR
jgi:DUF4097 and DUF4098 domain-containing protein YvlB